MGNAIKRLINKCPQNRAGFLVKAFSYRVLCSCLKTHVFVVSVSTYGASEESRFRLTVLPCVIQDIFFQSEERVAEGPACGILLRVFIAKFRLALNSLPAATYHALE